MFHFAFMGELGFSVKLGGKELKPSNTIITSAVWNTIDREKLFKSEFFGSFFFEKSSVKCRGFSTKTNSSIF